MQRIFHTPEGVRDIYSQECNRKQKLQEKLHRVFHQYGFEDIETPTFEYFEVFSKEVGTIPSRELYKFFDREGNTLVLRPDFTPSVSRACATYFNPEKEVVSLCYTGNTFINNSSFRGRLKETTQMGVERMGDDSPEADAEILAMTVECLLATGLTEFQVSVGQVDYYKAIFSQTGMSQEEEEELRELISQKNYFGVEELVKNKNMDKSLARVLSQLPQMFGSTEVLEKAKSLTDNPQALKAVARLEEIYELLKVGTIPSRELYKFFDREGNTLVLRPDFTPSVSRACATYFNPEKEVVSLCYTGNTFINNSSFRGRLKETTQMGVERMGDDSPEADAEILAMTVECLLATGLTEFQVSVGQVDYYKAIFSQTGMSQEEEEELRELISQKNYFGVEELVKNKNMDKSLARVLSQLPQMFGSTEVLEKAKSLTDNPQALKAVARLEEIYELLKVYGYEKYVTYDFAMLSKYHYYTGIIFQAYTYGTGEALIKGGRYNQLMKHFGKPAASIGFAIVVDNLLMALSRQKIEMEEEEGVTVITYRKENRIQAIQKAKELRAQGRNVALRPEKVTKVCEVDL